MMCKALKIIIGHLLLRKRENMVLLVDADLWLSDITALPLQGAHPASRLFPG